jgi:hypothetical protein
MGHARVLGDLELELPMISMHPADPNPTSLGLATQQTSANRKQDLEITTLSLDLLSAQDGRIDTRLDEFEFLRGSVRFRESRAVLRGGIGHCTTHLLQLGAVAEDAVLVADDAALLAGDIPGLTVENWV